MNYLKFVYSMVFLITSTYHIKASENKHSTIDIPKIVAALNSIIVCPIEDSRENIERYFNLKRIFIHGITTKSHLFGNIITIKSISAFAHGCHEINAGAMAYLLNNSKYTPSFENEIKRAETILTTNKKNNCDSCILFRNFLETRKNL